MRGVASSDILDTTQTSENSGSDGGQQDAFDALSSPFVGNSTTSSTTVVEDRSKKKSRRIRTSRLDYSCTNSSINRSEFWGFLNLLNICVAVFLISDPLIRFYETGRFFDPTLAHVMFEDTFLLLFLWLQCYLWSFTAFFAHRSFAAQNISRRTLRLIQVATQGIMLFYTVALCLYNDWSILPCGFALIVTTIFFMKMHSFTESLLDLHDLKAHLVMKHGSLVDDKKRDMYLKQGVARPALSALRDWQLSEIRQRRVTDAPLDANGSRSTISTPTTAAGSLRGTPEDSGDDGGWHSILEYDLNTSPTFRYYLYYLTCPVLVYEPHYPRSHSFRPVYFCRKLIEMLSEMVVLYFISVRYLIPIMQDNAYVSPARAILQLLWPMLVCYILVFFILFESICNLLAELTCFGDREFYHHELGRILQKMEPPSSRIFATACLLSILEQIQPTFFMSALFHELIMATCFKVIRFWMFGLMMLQIPLIRLGHRYEGTNIGNCIFWVGMILGLPLLSVAYGREYAGKHGAA